MDSTEEVSIEGVVGEVVQPLIRTISCVGETEFIEFNSENTIFLNTNFFELPTVAVNISNLT